jgi:four helix bundle protein
MSRDHRKLRVFQAADQAVERIYRDSGRFPASERFGLQGQLRRAAVSVCANIVEGSARLSASEYIHFLNVATGSAAEARYFIGLARRLGYLTSSQFEVLADQYNQILAGLQALVRSLLEGEAHRRKPPALPEPEA